MSYDPSINKTDKLDLTPNNHIDNNFHPVDSGLNATNDHWGTQLADVVPLHPPGTFSRNTDGGDLVNGIAAKLGVKPPANVIKFPGRK